MMDLHGCGQSLERMWVLLFAAGSLEDRTELENLVMKLCTLNWGARVVGALEAWLHIQAKRAKDFETFSQSVSHISAAFQYGFANRFGGHCDSSFDGLVSFAWAHQTDV